jgi:hypothetical protein
MAGCFIFPAEVSEHKVIWGRIHYQDIVILISQLGRDEERVGTALGPPRGGCHEVTGEFNLPMKLGMTAKPL